MNDHDPPADAPATVAGFITRSAAHVADALRYWEPRRVIYNLALAAVVVAHLVAGWPESRAAVIAHFLSTNILGSE